MRVCLVAGETSGDMLGSMLLAAMRAHWPELQAYGIGGAQMQAQGFTAWWPCDKLAVHGFSDALLHLREIWGIRRALKKRLLQDPPDVFIGIDAPDFNLGLEAQLKARGVKTIHFISPSIWAWRGGRIKNIAQSVNHMLCVFHFEVPLYGKANIPATYVGHPLASKIPLQTDIAAAKAQLGFATERPLIAVLPGSRAGEIKRITPRFIEAIKLLQAAGSDLQFVIPAVPAQEQTLRDMLVAAGLEHTVKLLHGQSHEALAACDVTLIASGTATLEAMLYKKPMVISYVASNMSAMLMRRMGYLPWVGLPNILAGEGVVPELLQENATPKALADAVLHWLDNPQQMQALQSRFTALHKELQRDTAELSCQVIEHVLAENVPKA